MNWHMLAFEKASAGGVSLEDVPGIQDDIFPLDSAAHYLPPDDVWLLWSYMLSPNITLGQISAPHFRALAVPAVDPVDVGTTPTSIPAIDINQPPFTRILQNDSLTTLQTDNAGAGIQKVSLLGVSKDLNRNIPQGEIYTLRATSANTTNTRTWQNQTIVFDQTIPVGEYAVIGMAAVGANLIAARLLFPAQLYRPGCLGQVSEATKPRLMFRKGRMGEWGRFTNTAAPSVQLLGAGALVTQVYYIDVVKTR